MNKTIDNKRKSPHSAIVLPCLALIICQASFVLSKGFEKYGKTDHQLFHSLNDPGLTAKEVHDMLDAVDDKDNVWIGPNSVADILAVSDLTMENCDVAWQREFLEMQKVFKEGEDIKEMRFKWDKPLNLGFNYGLARFMDHYLPMLIEYCGENKDLVFRFAVQNIGDQYKQHAEALAKVFPSQLDNIRDEEVIKYKDKFFYRDIGIDKVTESCEEVRLGLDFPKEFKGPETVEDLSEETRGLFEKWARVRRVCEILLRTLNKAERAKSNLELWKAKFKPRLPKRYITQGKKLMAKPELEPEPEEAPKKLFNFNKSISELINKLNSTSLSVEQVEAILEAVEDKDQALMHSITIKLVLDIRIHSIDKCLDDKLRSLRQVKRLFSQVLFVQNLDQYLEHYWDKLLRYCGENIEQVVNAEKATIEKKYRETIKKIVPNIEAERITVHEVRKALDNFKKSFGRFIINSTFAQEFFAELEESCDAWNKRFEFLELLQQNIKEGLPDSQANKLRYFLRAKKVCFIYTDLHNLMSPTARLDRILK